MDKRSANFEALASHCYLKGIFAKLNANERALCREFIAARTTLDRHQFAMQAARWYLDNPAKPKRLSGMIELLLAANNQS